MKGQSYMPTHLFQNTHNAQLHLIKRMKTAVVVAVVTKINNKKVICDGAFLRKQLTAKSR